VLRVTEQADLGHRACTAANRARHSVVHCAQGRKRYSGIHTASPVHQQRRWQPSWGCKRPVAGPGLA
jgi:nucleotidyltransferase/DNA polymerase involved in DNA repair